MKHVIIFLVLICFYLNGQAQHQKNDTLKHVYITLKSYKQKYKKPLTQKDSLSFLFKDNDTLVLVENYLRPNGVGVPYEYKDSTFLHYYKKIAFRTKSIDSLDKKQTMRYWKDDIKVFFSKSVEKRTRNDFMSFAKSVANQVDSLNISEVKHVEDSNYIVYYFGDYEYESRMKHYKNSDFYLSWNKHQQIYSCSVKIDTDLYFNEALIQEILKDYFIITLGHFSKINDFSCESYFADCYSKNKHLTNLDIELIKYHYSYGICKGTNLETFEEQHEIAKETLNSHNRKVRFYHPY